MYGLGPLEKLTRAILKEFGNVWLVNLFALNAGALSLSDLIITENELFDPYTSICRRVRYAVEHRGGVIWWNKQLDSIETKGDTMLFLLVLFIWATPAVVKSVLPRLASLIDSLPTEEWYKLFDAIETNKWKGPQRNKTKSQELLDILPKEVSDRIVLCVGARLSMNAQHALYRVRLLNYSGQDRKILAVCQWFAGHALFSKPSDPNPYLSLLKRGYQQGVEQIDPRLGKAMSGWTPPLDLSVAEAIAAHPDEYPSFLLKTAEQVCQFHTASEVIPVGIVAQNEKCAFA